MNKGFQAGVCLVLALAAANLRADDYMAPIHRDLGAHLWRGNGVARIDGSEAALQRLGRGGAATGQGHLSAAP